MSGAALRNCGSCGQFWPKAATHRLRSLHWLRELPRHISPSNGDIFLHDGTHAQPRFLMIEVKRPDEPWQPGQQWLLRALSGQRGWTVRVLTGYADDYAELQVVSLDGIGPRQPTLPEHVRESIAAWLDGKEWRDPAFAPEELPAKHFWRTQPIQCWTCGRLPIGTFSDGSPRYNHGHNPDGTTWFADSAETAA